MLVVDAFGDGNHELVTETSVSDRPAGRGPSSLRRTAEPSWSSGSSPVFGVADSALSGKPDLVEPIYRNPQDTIEAHDSDLSQLLGEGTGVYGNSGALAIGQLMQDGLPYSLISNNDNSPYKVAAFGPDFSRFAGSRARAARRIPRTSPSPTSSDRGARRCSRVAQLAHPVSAMVAAGRCSLIPALRRRRTAPEGREKRARGGRPRRRRPRRAHPVSGCRQHPSYNDYGNAGFVIYGSNQWAKMPKTWNGYPFYKGHADEALKISEQAQPRITTNTFNDQYFDIPATVLANIKIASADIQVNPALPASGQSATVTVTVHNTGGLPGFQHRRGALRWKPGCRRCRDRHATSPGRSPRSRWSTAGWVIASGQATFTWSSPYPDGEHDLYAIADPDDSIQEPDYADNTASTRVFVAQGGNLSDVAIVAGSMASSPAAPLAGSPATLLQRCQQRPAHLGCLPSLVLRRRPLADGSNLLGEAPARHRLGRAAAERRASPGRRCQGATRSTSSPMRSRSRSTSNPATTPRSST